MGRSLRLVANPAARRWAVATLPLSMPCSCSLPGCLPGSCNACRGSNGAAVQATPAAGSAGGVRLSSSATAMRGYPSLSAAQGRPASQVLMPEHLTAALSRAL